MTKLVPLWLLLDGRAKAGTDDAINRASVMDTAYNETEARATGASEWRGFDAIWYDPKGELRWDVPPCGDKPK